MQINIGDMGLRKQIQRTHPRSQSKQEKAARGKESKTQVPKRTPPTQSQQAFNLILMNVYSYQMDGKCLTCVRGASQ